MAVNLSTLLFRVRASVSDISVANMDDLAMYRELQKANNFVQAVKRSTVTDIDLEIPLICLAAYYAHATYTLLNARQQGTIDESALLRDNNLRRIAQVQLELISSVSLDENLNVDAARYERIRGLAFALSPGVMYDWRL